MGEFIAWCRSEPRLAFNKTVVLRYGLQAVLGERFLDCVSGPELLFTQNETFFTPALIV